MNLLHYRLVLSKPARHNLPARFSFRILSDKLVGHAKIDRFVYHIAMWCATNIDCNFGISRLNNGIVFLIHGSADLKKFKEHFMKNATGKKKDIYFSNFD